jgi:predicted nucleic acid-binding protein
LSIQALVLDASAAMALFLHEEAGKEIENILEKLISGNGQIFVPSLFWFEVGNTLVTALNRKRISHDELQGIETDISDLPIATDTIPNAATRLRIREIAINKNLSYYDAAYVELSKRLQLPLQSFDKKVLAAI